MKFLKSPKLKNALTAFLSVSGFLGVILVIVYCIYFPLEVKSLVDFRPKPPYLPFSVPFPVDQAPQTTTVYFVVSESDYRITLFLNYIYKEDKYDELRDLLENNRSDPHRDPKTGIQPVAKNDDSKIPQRFTVEVSSVINGREEVVFSEVFSNPSQSGWVSSLNLIESRLISFPFIPKKNEIYRFQITNEIATQALSELARVELKLCQGCAAK